MNLSRTLVWGQLLAATAITQLAIQAFSFATGLVVVRTLSTAEYAAFTVCTTVLGAMTVLADSGVGNAVLNRAGRVWQDRYKLSAVIATGTALRFRIGVWATLISAPLILFLLRGNEVEWSAAIVLLSAVTFTFFSGLPTSILEVPAKVHQSIHSLQKTQMISAAVRFMMIVGAVSVSPTAAAALLCAGLAQLFLNKQLMKDSTQFIEEAHSSVELKVEINQIVQRVLPSLLFMACFGQTAVIFLTVYATSEAVAQFGALTKLAAVLHVFNLAFSIVIVPRFARLNGKREILVRRFAQVVTAKLVLYALICYCAWNFSQYILALLGPNYHALKAELTLMAGLCGLVNICTAVTGMSAVRGLNIRSSVFIPVLSTVFVLACLIFPKDGIIGVISISVLFFGAELILRTVYFLSRCSNAG